MASGLSADERRQLTGLPAAQLRQLAQQQLELARAAYEDASKLPWYANIPARIAESRRWAPFRQTIQIAEEALKRGDSDKAEADKRDSYLFALERARVGAAGIAEEIGQAGKWSVVLELDREGKAVAKTIGKLSPRAASAVTTATEAQKRLVQTVQAAPGSAVDALKRAADKAKDYVKEPLAEAATAALVIAGAVLLLRSRK